MLKPSFFGHFDVGTERFIGWRGVNAIWPKTLVKRTELKVGFVVQQHARETFFIFAEGNLAHAEVTLDFVDGAGCRVSSVLRVDKDAESSGDQSLAPLTGRVIVRPALWMPDRRVANRREW